MNYFSFYTDISDIIELTEGIILKSLHLKRSNYNAYSFFLLLYCITHISARYQ